MIICVNTKSFGEIFKNARSGYITKDEMLDIIGNCPEFSGDKVGRDEVITKMKMRTNLASWLCEYITMQTAFINSIV